MVLSLKPSGLGLTEWSNFRHFLRLILTATDPSSTYFTLSALFSAAGVTSCLGIDGLKNAPLNSKMNIMLTEHPCR